jgi:dolichol-phosphate mannosyltransferase
MRLRHHPQQRPEHRADRHTEPGAGWSSLMSVTLVIGGMVMILLGFIGVYVGYIFQEVKKWPVYLLKKDEK